MTYHPWPTIAKFSNGATQVYFNRGTTKAGEPALAINVNGAGGYKSKIVLFAGMKLDMIENLVKATKEVFDFDYIAYLQATGVLSNEVGDPFADVQMDYTTEVIEEPAPVRSVIPDPPTEEPEDDGGCEACGNLPGSGSWRFGWHNGVHLSQCLECDRIYRNAGG